MAPATEIAYITLKPGIEDLEGESTEAKAWVRTSGALATIPYVLRISSGREEIKVSTSSRPILLTMTRPARKRFSGFGSGRLPKMLLWTAIGRPFHINVRD